MISLKEPSKEAEELSNVITGEFSHYTLSEDLALHLAEVILDAGYQKTSSEIVDKTIFNTQDT